MIPQLKILRAMMLIGALSLWLSIFGCAQSIAEEWKTVIPCGPKNYVVTSHCRPSKDPFELNTCQPGQQLSSDPLSIQIPSSKKILKSALLFATHWQCVAVDTSYFLMIDYSTGTSQSEADEAVEFYDSQLLRINDAPTIKRIRQNTHNAPEGYINSIYPGEGS
jgi:hypothetical protein